MSALQRFEQIGRPRLLVVGDLMLDRYTWGRTERISPEAPVILLEATTEEVRPGGAASVAALVAALEAECQVAGVIGTDADGTEVLRVLGDSGVDTRCVLADAHRPTTRKERYLSADPGRRGQQILRVDRELRFPLAPALEAALRGRIAEALPRVDAVLVADYAKGVCTPRILQELISSCRASAVPVLVDPGRGVDPRVYSGASLLKPNRRELEQMTGSHIEAPRDAVGPARKLMASLGLDAVVVTLDRDGMVVVPNEGEPKFVEAIPCETHDVTGAGDSVLAMFGLCAGAGIPYQDAAPFANAAAALEVQRTGVVAIRRRDVLASIHDRPLVGRSKLVDLPELVQCVGADRDAGRRIVLTNGCFDLLHAGHVRCLAEAAALGDVLIVALNGDASVRRLKGPERPILAARLRAAVLEAIGDVDYVIVFEDDSPTAIIDRIRPDVLVKGGTTATIPEQALVEAYGGIVCRTTAVADLSTSDIVKSIVGRDPTSESASAVVVTASCRET